MLFPTHIHVFMYLLTLGGFMLAIVAVRATMRGQTSVHTARAPDGGSPC